MKNVIRLSLLTTMSMFFVILTAQAQCPASVPLTINGIAVTESRCQSSGTATVSVSGGGGSYMYSIIAGPVLLPVQSSNVLQSLEAGNYTVRVTDLCNISTTRNFTISGTYSVLQPVTTLKHPDCQGNSDGGIKIDVTDGRAPFTYALISPSPVVTSPQASNEFTGLPGGDYTYQVADSCGNYQTRMVTLLSNDNGHFNAQFYNFYYQACDSFAMPYVLNPDIVFNFKAPYTVTMTFPDGSTQSKVLTDADILPGYPFIADTLRFRFHHVTGQTEIIHVNIVNRCGQAMSYPYFFGMSGLDMYASSQPAWGCPAQYIYTMDAYKDHNPANAFQINYHCDPVTYSLYSPSNVLLATQVNNGTFSGYTTGSGYKVVREDCCRKDSIYFGWSTPPPVKINGYTLSRLDVKKENTVGLNLSVSPLMYGRIVVAAGPPSVTFKDGTVHHYTYPDTLFHQPFGTTSVNFNYLTAGNYTIYALDSCGNSDTLQFTIDPSELRHDTFSISLVKGCLGANKIKWSAATAGYPGSGYYGRIYEQILGMLQYADADPDIDSFVNVNTGTYTVEYTYWDWNYQHTYLKGMSGYTADTILRTVDVPAYTQPQFAAHAAIAVCAGDRHVALLPDSSKGVQPYQYRIAAGAITTSLQSSPVFSHLATGTYKLLMEDGCGNSYSRDMTVDTLSVPEVTTTGSTCQGNAATLSLPSWPFYEYTWELPNGATVQADSLHIDPMLPADTGLYRITVTSNIAGCTDSKTREATLRFCSTLLLPLRLTAFSGTHTNNGFRLQWHTAAEEQTNYFTIERSGSTGLFEKLGQLKAVGTGNHSYTFTDGKPLPGLSYYRLRITDQDGSDRYSRTLRLDNKHTARLVIYPRLIHGSASIYITHEAAAVAGSIQVVSMQGVVLRTVPVAQHATQTVTTLHGLPAGSYFIVYKQQQQSVKVVKM